MVDATYIQKKLEQLADEFDIALDIRHCMIKNESIFTFIDIHTHQCLEIVIDYSAEDLPSDSNIIVLKTMASALEFFNRSS